jgi:hypothetical protein
MIGRLTRVPLTEVWPHEAANFTPWLQDNIDVLNEVLGITLSNPEREQAAGSFSVDIVAEDVAGQPVVIENQLRRSDHDHLGKILTYLTSIGASTAVWIVSDPRPEHVTALSWLNETGAASFYLVKVEAIRVGDSPAAPLFTVIVRPSDEISTTGARGEFAERHKLRLAFWKGLLERSRGRTTLFSGVSPSRENWLNNGAGKSGLALTYVIRMEDADVALNIDRGKDSWDENRELLDQLMRHRSDIERNFGGALQWKADDASRVCRISAPLEGTGLREQDRWPELQDRMIDTMIRFERALRPYLDRLS